MKLRVFTYAVLVIGCVFSIFPYFLTVLTAFKGPGQLSETMPWEPGLPPSTAAFERLFGSGFGGYLVNTALVTAGITLGQVVFAILAAYAFARLSFPGRDALFWVYLSTLMVPPRTAMRSSVMDPVALRGNVKPGLSQPAVTIPSYVR